MLQKIILTSQDLQEEQPDLIGARVIFNEAENIRNKDTFLALILDGAEKLHEKITEDKIV